VSAISECQKLAAACMTSDISYQKGQHWLILGLLNVVSDLHMLYSTNGKVTAYDDLGRTEMEVTVAYFKIMSKHWTEGTEENNSLKVP
jgi:hypothetical protein